MNSLRIKSLKSASSSNFKSVVYVMSRDQRVFDNFALIHACNIANKNGLPLVVVFNLYPEVKNRTRNQYEFMLKGLESVASDLKNLNIEFLCTINKTANELANLIQDNFKPHTVVFDFSPLKGPSSFRTSFAKEIKCNCDLVDTHNIVPVWITSDKEEFAAYTIRPKIKKLLEDFIEVPENLEPILSKFTNSIGPDFCTYDYDFLIKSVTAKSLDNYMPIVEPGQYHALMELDKFIETKLINYFVLRNDPTQNFQSNLSAYLHFGNLYSLTITNKVLEFCKKNSVNVEVGFKQEIKDFESLSFNQKLKLSTESFLEELIIRKELSDNYCFYNNNHNSINGAKQWAIKTLKKHSADKRDVLYSIKELEFAKTKDHAWNAAQIQLITTGKIHGYMRMYWAKKMLEWTANAEQAIDNLIYLNDKYSLDGYDPNGYVGILWSIAGLHDRVWFERPIFGQIRYMNANGLSKKFNVNKYIEQVQI